MKRLRFRRTDTSTLRPSSALLGLALGLVALLAPCPATAQVDSVGLGTLRARYLRAYDAGDADAMAPLYEADAVRMPYDAPAQEGREAIVDGYRSTFRSRPFDPTLRFEVLEVRVVGGLAVERGRYVEILRPHKGGTPLREQGKYVVVATRDDAGRWRYTWSIFNRDGRATPAG